MDRAVWTLVKNAASGSAEEQAAAAFQLAMLLEKNTRPSDEIGFYETVLPPDVAGIRLDEEAQAEILRELARRVSSARVPAGVFWAAGKALPQAGAPVVVDILAQHADLSEDPEAAYQALIALENCLDYDREQGRSPQAQMLFRNDTVIRFLRQAAASAEPRLAEQAPRLLRRLTRAPRGR
jgi:hypothetical protein